MHPDERFWRRVAIADSGCWEWTGTLSIGGYGHFSAFGETWPAHRYSFMRLVGPLGDLFVCHHCDNRKCVRPDHLFLGTASDNMRDMIAKGRSGWQNRAATRRPSADEQAAFERACREAPLRVVLTRCGKCGSKGHNRRTCENQPASVAA